MSGKTNKLLRRFARAAGLNIDTVKDRFDGLSHLQKADALALSRKFLETKEKVAENIRKNTSPTGRVPTMPEIQNIKPPWRNDGTEGQEGDSGRGTGSEPVPPHDDAASA